METMAAVTMDMNSRLQELAGHAGARRRRGLALGHGEFRHEERGRVSWRKGEGCGALWASPWRPGGEEGPLEAPRWRPRRSPRHRAASGARGGRRQRLGWAGPPGGLGGAS